MCNNTCHKSCAIPNDDGKADCSVMENGKCKICIGNCHWNNHKNNNFIFDTIIVEEERNNEDLKKQYLDINSKKSEHE